MCCCSPQIRLFLFACVFGLLTILITLTIISGLYLFILSWSEYCQTIPTTCSQCETIRINCKYLIASTSLLTGQSVLVIFCFYSMVCFYVSIRRGRSRSVLDRDSTPDLPGPLIMAQTARPPTSGLPPYSETAGDTEALIRPRQPPNYEDITN